MGYSLLMVVVAGWAVGLTGACLVGGGAGGGSLLRENAYETSCPDAESIVFSWVENAAAQDPRMAASLLRLHFHDCFVNGCDASVLLDDTATFVGEKSAAPNVNSLRGFEVIDGIKGDLEMACPQTVSCADILAMAARDSVLLSGGPTWQVQLGRKDSLTASKAAANNNIPGPNSNVANLVSKFQNVGLTPQDMVTLSGAHTIGMARCSTFRSRLQSNSGDDVDREFLASLQQLCSVNSNMTLAVLDVGTPAVFDNEYYANLASGQGLLSSDQALFAEGGITREVVENYASDTEFFFKNFRMSMLRMGAIKPLTGSSGEIRRNCRSIN
ncbi:peroxidase 40 [Amborella trichopoda]|uniref:Peroxidase n=1 Tax=Amborella trichopoda TaxID=13333 RepID=U5D6H0_AMBTC|nr:peroxidase 40 [Amborella trichopoda]ERN18014.1 hypothetical protein AMTR_s00046p00166530 [Amborella trichopoda]|eukprot:XP_006856547.3 peroxidase 40 [Amborella trichopoda]